MPVKDHCGQNRQSRTKDGFILMQMLGWVPIRYCVTQVRGLETKALMGEVKGAHVGVLEAVFLPLSYYW